MYSLFNFIPSVSMGTLQPARWNYLKPNLKHNVESVISYYRKSPFAVKSQHFLVRLLHAIIVPKSQEIERYYDNVDAIALNIGMTMGMTSSISRGHIFNGVFYGKGNHEILIADNTSFNPIEAEKNWEELEPIKVLRHPRSDLNFNLPDGTNTGVEDGFVVISVNIPMLAVQYRSWRRQEGRFSLVTGASERNIMQFIHMYPIPNMLRSHADLAIFNRLFNWTFGLPMGEATVKHPFFLIDYHKDVDHTIDVVLDNLDRVHKNFYDTLGSIPAITEDSMQEVLQLPEIPATRQVIWALTIARLPTLRLLFKLAEAGGGNKNQLEKNHIIRKLKEYKTANFFKSYLPKERYLDLQAEIEDLGL